MVISLTVNMGKQELKIFRYLLKNFTATGLSYPLILLPVSETNPIVSLEALLRDPGGPKAELVVQLGSH